jgi:outer membrane receptor protein involved in Fe transport
MNMWGRRLYANGFGGVPDVYEINGTDNTPTPDLRFNIRKRFMEHFSVGFRAENILNYNTERNVEFGNSFFIQERFSPGRTFTLSLGYSIE